MRVGVFGGSFDPPHKGHVAIAMGALSSGVADKVLFVPAECPPHKPDRNLTPYRMRRKMLELAIHRLPSMEISDVEHERKGVASYTIDTLDCLAERMPGDELILLIGADSLRQLHTWHRASDIVSSYSVAYYPRPGEEPDINELAGHWGVGLAEKLLSGLIPDVPTFKISSSELRSNVANSRKAVKFIDRGVMGFIRTHKLYGT